MLKPQEKLLQKALKLPDSPGVYKFLGSKNQLFYIGKATSLRSRVRSYFSSDIAEKRSELISRMVNEATDIKFEQTESVLEALILEAELIKKFLPPYNSIGKDQKSWNYVVITDEKWPRVLLVRGRNLESFESNILESFGPFTNSSQLREALKIIRKIFPFRDTCGPNQGKPCFNHQIGLCPGVCVGKVSEKEYKKTIQQIIQFFRGKKKELIKELEKEMKALAKTREFEKAEAVKRKVFALKHIEDIALIKRDRIELQNSYEQEKTFRIEAYDIAHTSGTDIVGVMTVIENGEVNKNQYRLFKIRGQKGADDTRALEEVLMRRLKHTEWQFPDLIVVDGAIAQLNAAKVALERLRETGEPAIKIPIVAVTKDARHKPREIQTLDSENEIFISKYNREIILANSESHRFAITYHRKLRDKLF